MSEARRMAETLESARELTLTASRSAGQYRHRGTRGALPQHISDLGELAEAIVAIRQITKDLAAAVKYCADNVRACYSTGFSPSGQDWSQPLKNTAMEADAALSKLCEYLAKTSVGASHNALFTLRAHVRDEHQAARGTR